MSNETNNDDATPDPIALVKVVEFEFQPPSTTRPIVPVPVATLTLEPGQTLVVEGKVLHVTVGREQLFDLASQIPSNLGEKEEKTTNQ